MITVWVMVGRIESGLIVWTPLPGMLKLIVPPPMLLASRIACRNEPIPLSFVFMTVKTRGVLGVWTAGRDSCVIVGSGSRKFLTRMERADCAVSCAERPNPTSAEEMPVRTIARPKKTCEQKKADRELGFFFMRRLLTRPRARNP